jgi:hypothetical protein
MIPTTYELVRANHSTHGANENGTPEQLLGCERFSSEAKLTCFKLNSQLRKLSRAGRLKRVDSHFLHFYR